MTDAQKNTAYQRHYYRQLQRLRNNAAFSPQERARALKLLLLDVFEKATEEDNFNFGTLYARISFATHKYGINGRHIFQERKFRTRKVDTLNNDDLGKHIFTGFRLVIELTRAMFGGEVPDEWQSYLNAPYPFQYRKPDVKYRHDFLRVVAVDIDEEAEELVAYEEERPERAYSIPFGTTEVRNKMVGEALAIVRKVSGVPMTLNLINAELRAGDQLFPEQVVVHPDYLMDVTAVAESFTGDKNSQPWTSLAGRLIPRGPEMPLLRGNLVNSFLDRLVENPKLKFTELLGTIFQMQPLALSTYEDNDIRKLVADLKHHYLSVQRFVSQELHTIDVDREEVILEPSFMSPAYGVQGRLDVLQPAAREGQRTTIVELKTSTVWGGPKHGINHKNYIQTLLYDLVVNQAYGKEANVQSYILYSKYYDNMLRVAPPEHFQKLEAIAARNKLIGVELLLSKLGTEPGEDLAFTTRKLVGRLHPGLSQSKLPPYTERDHNKVLLAVQNLSDLEVRYFGAFLGFVAREQQISKTGEQRLEGVNGLASLWLDSREDKLERFELLDGLTFVNYDPQEAVLTLRRPEDDDRLVKFRQGDLIALYATAGREAVRTDPIRSQVHKSSILEVTPAEVRIKLRSHQLNDRSFRGVEFFGIEKDILDSSFRGHYNGLYTWITAEQALRDRWLGLAPPAKTEPLPGPIAATLTGQQNQILQKIIPAEDYFLLWGPPGTGKTSQMLHHLVKYLLDHTDESVLLVAYTNRAVDEICESIERIRTPEGEPFTNYLRLGSTLGVAPDFRDRLLQVQAKSVNRRSDLTDLVGSTRIFVSTVASVGSKSELFELKSFDRIVVDEASQILEPLLAGLLPKAPKALLIGDHKQLPAVVQQREAGIFVRDQQLQGIGLKSLGNSLFERLYRTAQANGWDWAYDQLSHQGRMHQDIMAFPALHFYEGGLHILPDTIAHHRTQLAPLNLAPAASPLPKKLSEKRMVFIETDTDLDNPDPKVNAHEAEVMVELITAFTDLYLATDRPIEPQDIGIITPYRAQIAHIRRRLYEANLNPDDYQVDTVERYQGGAKRIILISLCTNEDRQIDTLSQLSDEGVDRKLNVAITRAREHLVLVGCPAILRQSAVYGALIDHCEGC